MEKLNSVVIKFAGDSGDGMQLTGTQFSNTSALMGNDIATFPDFPAEIRAPAGTIAGVSGFQVQLGASEITTPGDSPDVLVAMNPAALKANLANLELGKTIIVNEDAFTANNIKKAGYEDNPLEDDKLNNYNVIKAKITSQTREALKDIELDNKAKDRCKNFYALGMTYYMFSRTLDSTENWILQKFGKKPVLVESNVKALRAGFNFADTIEVAVVPYEVPQATIEPGTYRQVNGNEATALGLLLASEKSGLDIFLGTYPITPASDILHHLSKYKNLGVKTFQAEDEIAGICTAIGASFTGALAVTSTSGPGLALKGEAAGLAVMYELPLVIIDVQRGGPSTGLPTKTEQSDLNIALFGRNGESPAIVVAAKSPSDSFHMAYEAARLSLTHMTPVILLTDGYIANGAEPWKIPNLKDYPEIKPPKVTKENIGEETYYPYKRDEETLVRTWAIPGTPGLEHRVGGIEKENKTGNVSYDPENHQLLTDIRRNKVLAVANDIPEQEVEGEDSGDLLVISWGGTYGSTHSAVKRLQEKGLSISLCHINYISPLPKNINEVFKKFKRYIVCELNDGQLVKVLNGTYHLKADSYNKVQGMPFKVSELMSKFESYFQ